MFLAHARVGIHVIWRNALWRLGKGDEALAVLKNGVATPFDDLERDFGAGLGSKELYDEFAGRITLRLTRVRRMVRDRSLDEGADCAVKY